MGLLDYLFDPQSYGGDGGLLSRLQPDIAQIPQSQGFPQQGDSFAQRFQPAIDNPLAAPPMAPTFASRFQPAQNNPLTPMAGNIDVGSNYSMPRIGNPSDYAPQQQMNAQAALPPNSQPTQGQLPPQQQPMQPDQPLPPAFGGTSYLDRVNSGGGLIGSLLGDTNQQKNLTAQYHAVRQTLIDNGEDPRAAASKAMLAVMNPEAGKTIISEALTNKEKFQQTGEDAFGNKQFGFVNERNQTVNGQGGDQSAGSSSALLAPGVKQIDSSLQGADYIKQFSPEVQAAVQNYVEGKSLPTGNPRKGFTQAVKMIAQKYGADTGQSVDDATYSARRTMRNQLSSSAPSSLGGQINIGNTAAGHLADLSQKALDLGNYDTGIAPLSGWVNSARGLGTEQAAKMEALKGAAQHYGQEITKFYAGSPGGTAERDRFIESVNGARSPKELAAILATEGELMRSRLDALGSQIKGVLGEEGSKQYPVLRADGQAALTKVEENVSKLKGNTSPAASNKPTTVIQNGHAYTLQPDGSYK